MKFTIQLILLVLCLGSVFESSQAKVTHQPHSQFPFLFEENKGQFHDNVLYRCKLPNGYLFLERGGFTYLFENQDDKAVLMELMHEHSFMGPQPIVTLNAHSIKVEFVGANTTGPVLGLDTITSYNNYFIGSDRNKWQSNVRSYRHILYPALYDNIMLDFYTDHNGYLKYDWQILANGDPKAILLRFEGADSIGISNDSLFVHTSCGDLIETPPIIELPSDNADETLAETDNPQCRFKVDGNVLSYDIYDYAEHTDGPGGFTIDPALIFSTYSGSRGDNFGFTATYDSKSNLYAGGITDGDQGNYPVTAGAIQKDYGGGGTGVPAAGLPCDITISKYDSAGSTLLWATYIGGIDNEYPHSLVVNQDDDLYVFGTSFSQDFPTSLTGYDTTYNGSGDIIVTKISEDGTTLLGSTFIGGTDADGLNSNSTLRYNYADDFRGDIIPDETQDIFIASCTKSPDFPMVDPVDSVLKFQEGCLLQLNSDVSRLKWSTFLGGGAQDALFSVKVDVDTMIYVGGGTSSSDLKTSTNAIHKDYLGNVDGYVAALDRKNHKLKHLTYWGTPQYDQVYFVELNNDGEVFVAGQTAGNIAPSNPTIYGEANKGQFIAKIDSGLSSIIWETSFGVRNNQIDISPSAFLVDNCEHIYMSGWGSEVQPNLNPGSTVGLETSSNAVQKTTDGNDFYLIVLDKDAQGLLYATYFGGDTTDDHVDGGTSRFDKKGVVYQSVCSSCPDAGEPGHQDFPVTPNAAFTENWSPRCSNASFKIDLQIKTDVDAYFVPNPIIGCQPVKVTFDNRSDVAQKFYWDLGDGTVDSTTLNPVHTYTEPGIYEITLTVIDSNTCNISDVFKRKIEVLGKSTADFEFELDPCTFEAAFELTSEAFDVLWKISDGTTETANKFKKVFEPGSINSVTLIVNQGTLCADSITKEVSTANAAQRDIFVPNIFTPTVDALNETYCIEGFLDGCDEFKLWIYNRWGELVFKTEDMNECWDGTVSQSTAIHPAGTYFYILEVTEGKFGSEQTETLQKYKTSGTITLIRD
ncbi:MAG: gliding motility-associated-like protein [Bacteroidia bacterium]|jgi:gliding motility-associated-like protein